MALYTRYRLNCTAQDVINAFKAGKQILIHWTNEIMNTEIYEFIRSIQYGEEGYIIRSSVTFNGSNFNIPVELLEEASNSV